MNKTNEVSSYLENISLLILGIFFLAFPLVFTSATTDPFILPKQILLAGVSLTTLILLGAKMISDQKVNLRQTPFDLPVFVFMLVIFLSAIFAPNRYDSLTAFLPLFFAAVFYYLLVNLVRIKSSFVFLTASLVAGASILSILSILSLLKVYILPFPFTHNQAFTPMGSSLDQIMYLALILPVAGFFAYPVLKAKEIKDVKESAIGFGAGTVVITIGLIISIYQLMVLQKLPILPFETGFQTAFAAISQDAGRTLQGFLFGSGFGTYGADFTRFKQAAYNLNPNLWSLTFFRSSSFILELLATTGILGVGALGFLLLTVVRNTLYKKTVRENAVYLALIITFVAMLILPFSFITLSLVFFLLGLFSIEQSFKEDDKYFDVELRFSAFKNTFMPLSTAPISPLEVLSRQSKEERSFTKFLPVTFFILFILFGGFIGFFVVRYVASDVIFQNSLVAASNNNGLQTYNDQINAIRIYPYRDAYHRIYSQTNIALATSLSAQQPKDSSPSAQTQQTITTLVQQAINSAQNATAISPQTVANWQNLSSIYRSLIGYGKDAESFAILANQQAILLDPNNPQQYVSLGGIYFQLRRWEDAQRQFQIAINLKPDFANAYYNLGHALENKGDLQAALTQYETVKTLIASDKETVKKLTEEIEALKKRIPAQQQSLETQSTQNSPSTQTQEGIGLDQPQNQMPKTKNQMNIPAPSPVIKPSTSPTPEVSTTPAPPSAPTVTTTPAQP